MRKAALLVLSSSSETPATDEAIQKFNWYAVEFSVSRTTMEVQLGVSLRQTCLRDQQAAP